MNKQKYSVDLDKSLRLLDSILNSPAKTPARLAKPTLQRMMMDHDEPIDDETTFLYPFEMNKTAKPANLSMTFHQWELEVGKSDASRIIPGKGVSQTTIDRLFEEFLATMQTHSSGQIFETLSELIQTCSDTLEIAKAKGKKQTEWWLVNERNTWRLIYCLYQNRINKQREPERMEEDLIVSRMSEKDVVSHLYTADNSIFESQLIIDWLEQNCLDSLEDGDFARPEHFTDRTIAWENTLHQLQNQNTKIPYMSSRPMVTHLDPDAPLREGLPLHDIDAEDDQRLLKQMFLYIRCGRLDDAQALAKHVGQAWRAVSLEGWRLYHDPNITTRTEEGHKLTAEGNKMRDIWKLCAWSMSEDRRVAVYERAMMGAFCGNVDAMLPVCVDWNDHLWARLKAAVDVRVEEEIRDNVTKHFEEMPENYWQNNLKLRDIFTELSSCREPRVRDEAATPELVVQKLLILDDVAELMREMRGWLASHGKPHFVRFLAHLVLVLRQLGINKQDEVGNEVLEAYVTILMSQGNPSLVAYYVRELPPADQVYWYATYLADVTDRDMRQTCLEAAQLADLDVEAITKAVVENVRRKAPQEALPDLKAELTAEDLEKISALDWVVFYPTQRAEALWQSNALVRHFLASGKVEAARRAVNKIPADSIELISKQHSRSFTGIDVDYSSRNLPTRIACSVREHFCHRAYLEAQESFTDWFEHFHNAKPTPPVKPSGGAVSFTDRVAFDHRKKLYETELERWKSSMNMQTKLAKQRLYNVLLFPEGGWLVDQTSSEGDAEDASRALQLSHLRQLCLPGVVLLLHSVMHEMAEYEESVRLAEIVVDERYCIYKVYTKQKLRDLLTKLCHSTIPLMNQKKDPWGYPM